SSVRDTRDAPPDPGGLANNSRRGPRRAPYPASRDPARFDGMRASRFDFLDLIGNVDGAQLLRPSSKRAQGRAWIDVTVLWTEKSSNQIVQAKFGNQPTHVGNGQHLAFCAE